LNIPFDEESHKITEIMPKHFDVPNLPQDNVLCISSKITISCPPAHAYKVMRDTSTWPSWNSFCPQAEVVPPNSQTTPAEILVRGSVMTLHVRLAPGSPAPRLQKEEVTEASEDGASGLLSISWSARSMPKFMLRSLRVNEFHPVTQDGTEVCDYRTWIQMSGPMAYTIRAMASGILQSRFDDWSQDLKRYAEQTWQQEQAKAQNL
jgi:hypothetical protein